MDILSLAIGFVVGSFTGAAGTYLGNKYTDKRRLSETLSQEDTQWKDLCNRFPAVINEMKEDVRKPEFHSVRKFFVKSSETTVNSGEPSFEYHTDIHNDLSTAINYLEDLGFIEDITPGNCPMYRMYEHFVDKLRND